MSFSSIGRRPSTATPARRSKYTKRSAITRSSATCTAFPQKRTASTYWKPLRTRRRRERERAARRLYKVVRCVESNVPARTRRAAIARLLRRRQRYAVKLRIYHRVAAGNVEDTPAIGYAQRVVH